jgi:hypothetical protein
MKVLPMQHFHAAATVLTHRLPVSENLRFSSWRKA